MLRKGEGDPLQCTINMHEYSCEFYFDFILEYVHYFCVHCDKRFYLDLDKLFSKIYLLSWKHPQTIVKTKHTVFADPEHKKFLKFLLKMSKK